MMKNYFYKFYCYIHNIAKIIIHKKRPFNFRMVSIESSDFSKQNKIDIEGPYINEIEINKTLNINKSYLFPVENLVAKSSNNRLNDSYSKKNKTSYSFGIELNKAPLMWEEFIDASKITDGYKNSGLHFTGFILNNINEWCLPSWVWTNAALVRLYCNKGYLEKALSISNILLSQQLDCGGWIVRNDYKPEGAIPTLAPNDSAYIANNAFLEIYKATKKQVFLEAAIKCADWIIKTSRPDGLVWSGYNMKNNKWDKEYIIVDTGFTAGLFANLYELTKDNKYKEYLEKFVNQYIKLFFNKTKKSFCTSINSNNQQVGGFFARGQAWALEGLIPAFKILQTNKIKETIELTVSNLMQEQLKNGGWAYNFSKPLLGEDCKGVSLIAKSLLEWSNVEYNDEIIISSQKALDWCLKHTANNGVFKGGIFSFCMEGAVVHNFYTKTAFVYSSAYAIEIFDALKKEV